MSAPEVDDYNGDGLADLQVGYRNPLTGASPRLRFLGGPGGLTGDRCELVP